MHSLTTVLAILPFAFDLVCTGGENAGLSASGIAG